jgi:hypothetical protein
MAGSMPAGRQRSCAAIVMTRADPGPGTAAAPAPRPARPRRDWQRLWWIPLGLCLAGLWAVFLLGDSLRVP